MRNMLGSSRQLLEDRQIPTEPGITHSSPVVADCFWGAHYSCEPSVLPGVCLQGPSSAAIKVGISSISGAREAGSIPDPAQWFKGCGFATAAP